MTDDLDDGEGRPDPKVWKPALAAARQASTLAQDAWDTRWVRVYRSGVRAGRSQLAAIEHATQVVTERWGPRPTKETK
jgi:hypothetical protein